MNDGTKALRMPPHVLLLSHLIQELPNVKDEMTKKLSTTSFELKMLDVKCGNDTAPLPLRMNQDT
jgi:hypothetical protein